MSADAFHVCYGLRWNVNSENEDEITLLEDRHDPRQLAAKRNKLDCWWGVTTDERVYFVLVGKRIAGFGWEGKHDLQMVHDELTRIAEDTKQKLRSAGFQDEPAWHYQFEPDY